MQSGMLMLEGGSGEKPWSPKDAEPAEPKGFVLTAEMIASLSDEQLTNWYHDQVEYDLTPGRANTRLLRNEINRRARLNATWQALR